MSQHPSVLLQLTQWVAEQLADHQSLGTAPVQLQALSGDAGFRCYFRLLGELPMLAVYAPPETEKNPVFVSFSEFLRDQGVHTPKIIAVNYDLGFMLIEDFGDALYGDQLDSDNAELLYGEAMMSLLRMQQLSAAKTPSALGSGEQPLADYDRSTLHREMALLHEWFIPQLLGHSLSDKEHAMLKGAYATLEESALEQAQVWVHRDFHSRNLIYREGQAPGVIDFQDAVRGPLTYDLVSLLRDCYVRWPPEQVRHWALVYANMAFDAQLLDPVGEQQFMRWFDLMGLQRHFKVLGIFARLSLRDGKHGYLDNLPLVIRYTLEVSEGYPQLSEFNSWFKRVLLPLCEQQSWYSDYRRAGDDCGKQNS